MRLFTTVLIVTLLIGCAGNGTNSDIDDSLMTRPKDSESPMYSNNTNQTDESKAQEKEPLKAEDESESGLDDTAPQEPLKAEDESESGLDNTAPQEPLKAEDESESGFVTKKSDTKVILSDNAEEGAIYQSSTVVSEQPLLLYELDAEPESGQETQSDETFYIYIPED